MKTKIFTLLLMAGVLTANAERFRDAASGFWFDLLPDGTVQTAAAENITLGEKEVKENFYDPNSRVYTVYGIIGTIDSAILNDNSMSWIATNGATCAGPNFRTNQSQYTIPSKVSYNGNEYTVTAIGDFSFASDYPSFTSSVGEYILPETIKRIGKGAFFGYPNMKKLDLKNVEYIGESAFEQCKIDNLEIPSSVKEISKRAFYDNKTLKTLVFNEGLEHIGESAFENCSALEGSSANDDYIHLPNSLLTIGAKAFCNVTALHGVTFGNSLQSVGEKAFYRVCFKYPNCYLPGTLTDIPEDAFNYQLNVSNFTDLYYPNRTPGDIDMNAFGLIDGDEGFNTFHQDYWIYATVCLHVPVGTREIYKQLEGWKYFKCIIDDIVDYNDPLKNVLGYAYIVPGETIELNKIAGIGDASGITWQEFHGEELPIDVDKKGNVVAQQFGSQIVLAYRDGEYIIKEGNNVETKPTSLAGAVIVFVCPTITVVYDVNNNTALPADEAAMRARPLSTNEVELADMMDLNATYEHRVVYDSFPKLRINDVPGVKLEAIQRAKTTADGEYVENGELADIDEKVQIDGDYLVPINPVVENRIITLSTQVNLQRTTTGVDSIELGDGIHVSVSGYVVTITGADDEALVTVVDMNGRTVHESTEKIFTLASKGAYIVTVDNKAFKALVR